MKIEICGDPTLRRVNPLGLIPKRYVKPFLKRDPEVIPIVQKWVEKNGLKILFTQQRAKGWENVWVTEEGDIFLNDVDNPPTQREIEERVRRAGAPQEILSGDLEDKLLFLLENEKPV
jgi:hypothetical protein